MDTSVLLHPNTKGAFGPFEYSAAQHLKVNKENRSRDHRIYEARSRRLFACERRVFFWQVIIYRIIYGKIYRS